MADWSSADLALLKSLLPAPLVRGLRQAQPPPDAVAAACAQLESTLAALAPFVPAPVLDLHMARRGPGRLHGLYLTGTVLCADLSGFTALSAELAEAGRQGSEEISALVNRLFTTLMQEITTCGGGVMLFGGDALTAFFDATRLGPAHAALAGAAALAMQARMDEFAAVPTSKGPFRLRLRIGVHSGEIFAAEVGDISHIELIVTGRVINRVVVVQERARPGEVIISAETLRTLDGAQTLPRRSDLYLLQALSNPPPLPPPVVPTTPDATSLPALLGRISAIQPFVPAAVPARFVRDPTGGGEFRPVTVLFAGFYPFRKLTALLDLPPVRAGDTAIVGRVFDTYYSHAQAVIHHYGGSINKIDMAPFGHRLLALFGAPTAHEDDPARAVQAAVALGTAVQAADQEVTTLLAEWATQHREQRARLRAVHGAFPQRVGIATGAVFAGIIGTPQRHEYTVMGQTVNLAARLVSAAHDGDILLTSAVQRAMQRAAPGSVVVEPVPDMKLKGILQPVPVFRVAAERDETDLLRGDAPLVGRAAELAQLLDLARHALAPGAAGGRVVALIGEPGMGKSRLVEEVQRRIRALIPSTVLIRDTCQSYEQTVPYAATARLLRQLLRLSPKDDPARQATSVRRQLENLVPEWSRFAPLLGPLLHLPLEETPLTQALTAEQRRDRLQDLVVTMFVARARSRPLALVVDDLQCADASSQDLLGRLAVELPGQRLLLLLTYRPAPGLAEPWRDLLHGAVIRLNELTPAESAALLTTLLEGAPPPELQPLIERTNGTPFFLEETIRYLLESGTLRRDPAGRWICTRPIDATAIPAQVEQLIIARLDRLDEDARMVAQIAAVIGPRFPERLLAGVLLQRRALGQHLQALVDAALLLPDDGAAEPAYQFRHGLVRDVVYSSLLFARRRALHAQVAAAIEQVYGAELDSRRVMLAEHYLRAEQWAQAFPHFVAAGQQAHNRYAHQEALALYQQALAIAPWRERGAAGLPPELAQLYENLGDVLALTGDGPGAREHYEQLLHLLDPGALEGRSDRPVAPTGPDLANRALRQATLQRKIGSTYEHEGNPEQALAWLTRAAVTIAQAPPGPAVTLEHAHILSDTGWVHFRHGDSDQAQSCLEAALAQISAQALYEEQAHILNRLGGVAWTRGDITLAGHYVEQSLVASAHSDDQVGQARALNNLGILTRYQGRIDDAIRYGLRALAINARIGNRREVAVTSNNLGLSLYYQGDYVQARRHLEQALIRAIEVRDLYSQMIAYMNLGRTFLASEEWEPARQAIHQSQVLAIQLARPADRLETHVALADIALQQGDLVLAQAEYAQAHALATSPESEEYGSLQRLEARLAFAQGHVTEALDLLTANEALFTRLHNAPEAARSHQLAAQMQAAIPIGAAPFYSVTQE